MTIDNYREHEKGVIFFSKVSRSNLTLIVYNSTVIIMNHVVFKIIIIFRN